MKRKDKLIRHKMGKYIYEGRMIDKEWIQVERILQFNQTIFIDAKIPISTYIQGWNKDKKFIHIGK